MLIFAPVALLILAALVVLLLHWLRPNFGAAWLIATGAGMLAWLGLLLMRARLPLQVVLVRYQPESLLRWSPTLLLDEVSWVYALALVTLLLAVLLTATARIRYDTNPYAWAGSLSLTALGLLAVMAGNLFMLTLGWAALDILELVLLSGSLPEARFTRSVVVAFSTRAAGLMLAWWALAVNPAQPSLYDIRLIGAASGLFLLLATGFRLGVLPLHLAYGQEPRMRRGLGSELRLVPAASSLMLLARLPAQVVPEGAVAVLQAFTVLAALYAAGRWLVAENELEGRPYFIIALAASAVYAVVCGDPAASIPWGALLVLAGGMLFLFSTRARGLLVMPALAVWGLSSLPLSAASAGWAGAVSEGALPLALMLLAHVLLVLGYLRHALAPADALSSLERWALFTYPFGLLLPVLVLTILPFLGWKGVAAARLWWPGLVVSLVCLAVVFVYWRWLRHRAVRSLPVVAAGIWALDRLGRLMRLDWLYLLFWQVYTLINRPVSLLTTILEGEGGVLWALLLLALLITLLASGGAASGAAGSGGL